MKFSALARVATAAGIFATLAFVPAFAADKTRDDVVGIVKRAVVYLQANGPDKSYAEFSNPKGSFVDGELYMSVYDLKGDCLAHGADASKVGKDLSSAKDADGKLYVQERVTLAATQANFWQNLQGHRSGDQGPGGARRLLRTLGRRPGLQRHQQALRSRRRRRRGMPPRLRCVRLRRRGLRSAHQPARQRASGLAAPADHLAGDDGGVVAPRALE